MKRFYYFLTSVFFTIIFIFPTDSFSQRTEGAIVFYTFETVESGDIIKDVSGVDPVIDLVMTSDVTKIAERNGVVIADPGQFYDQGLFSTVAPEGLTTAIQATNAMTVEFWGLPIDTLHDDARLVTYSYDGGNRNFSLMFEYGRIETRIRTAISGPNGYEPNWIVGSPQDSETPTAPFHIIWTYDNGAEYVYFNGELMGEFTDRGGDITSWDNTYKLIIGVEDNNTATKRQFEGDVYMVAIYDKALSPEEVLANFNAGSVPEVSSVEDAVSYPSAFILEQNYPNPFNPSTNISFTLDENSHTLIKVYNLLGEEVAILVDQNLNAGSHTIQFNGSDLESGVYFYNIITGDNQDTKKMMLIK